MDLATDPTTLMKQSEPPRATKDLSSLQHFWDRVIPASQSASYLDTCADASISPIPAADCCVLRRVSVIHITLSLSLSLSDVHSQTSYQTSDFTEQEQILSSQSAATTPSSDFKTRPSAKMGVFYETIPDSLIPWIHEQQMLFVYVPRHIHHLY